MGMWDLLLRSRMGPGALCWEHRVEHWNSTEVPRLGISTCFWSCKSEVKSVVAQSCLTLCNPMAYSPPGSFIHPILQARYLSGLLCPSPGDLSTPGIEPGSPALRAESLPSEPPGKLLGAVSCHLRSWAVALAREATWGLALTTLDIPSSGAFR